MYLPIWILYWFSFVPTYAIKFGLLFLALRLTTLFFRNLPHVVEDWFLLKGLLVSFLAEFVGLCLFYLFEMKLFPETYFDKYSLCSIIVFSVVSVLLFLLHYLWTGPKVTTSPRQRLVFSFLSTLFTAPYMFIILSP